MSFKGEKLTEIENKETKEAKKTKQKKSLFLNNLPQNRPYFYTNTQRTKKPKYSH